MKRHNVRIVALSGPGAGLVFDFSRRVTLGRDPDCQLIVPDPALSRRHVELKWDQGRVLMEDLDSANGTWVNNHKVKFASLQSGDDFRIGETTFRIEFKPPKPLPAQTPRSGVSVAKPQQPVLSPATIIALLVSLLVVLTTWWLFFRPQIEEVIEEDQPIPPIFHATPPPAQ